MLFFRGVGERQRLLVVHLTRSGGMKRDTHLTGTDGWYRSTTGVAHFLKGGWATILETAIAVALELFETFTILAGLVRPTMRLPKLSFLG